MGLRFSIAVMVLVIGLQLDLGSAAPKPFLFFRFGGNKGPVAPPTVASIRPIAPIPAHGHIHRPAPSHGVHRPPNGFGPVRPLIRPPMIRPAAGLHGPF